MRDSLSQTFSSTGFYKRFFWELEKITLIYVFWRQSLAQRRVYDHIPKRLEVRRKYIAFHCVSYFLLSSRCLEMNSTRSFLFDTFLFIFLLQGIVFCIFHCILDEQVWSFFYPLKSMIQGYCPKSFKIIHSNHLSYAYTFLLHRFHIKYIALSISGATNNKPKI